MKDIQRDVKALEVAMEVATDIQDKPYAYAVARIQEAILGVNVVESITFPREEPSGEFFGWIAKLGPNLHTSKSLTIIHPGGHHCSYNVPFETSDEVIQEFLSSFNSGYNKLRKSWHLVLSSTSAWYLRKGSSEIPLGVVSRSTMGEITLLSLQKHLETL